MTPKEKFLRLVYLALQKYRIVPKNDANYIRQAQAINMIQLYGRIKDLEGCVVECGVAQGRGLTRLKVLSDMEDQQRKIYGFDTFEGLPEPESFEGGSKGQFATSKSGVIQFFKDTQHSIKGVTLIEGNIRDTLKNFFRPVAFVHVDVDLYEGHVAALKYLWPLMVPGAIMLFDDAMDQNWQGAIRAVHEFVQKNGLKLQRAEIAKKVYLVK